MGKMFDTAKTAQLRREIADARGHVLIYGTGAAYIAERWELLLYCDVTRWEIQQRQRRHKTANIGAQNASSSARSYTSGLTSSTACRGCREALPASCNRFYLDTNLAQSPKTIRVPTTGRHWPRQPGGRFGWCRSSTQGCGVGVDAQALRPARDAPNFAWCFDCVPEENSLRFGFGNLVIETPALYWCMSMRKNCLAARS